MGKPAIDSLPCTAGIGLRAPHYREVLQNLPELGWVEVHSENFFGGGSPLHTLLKVREHYPVSLHGVGMGLASTALLDRAHLSALHRLCDAVQPAAVSDTCAGILCQEWPSTIPWSSTTCCHFPIRKRHCPMWRSG